MTVNLEKLKRWNELRETIAAFKTTIDEEMTLRKELFAEAFPSPVEGTNNLELPGGWVLKTTYKLDRKLDSSALPAVLAELRKHDVPADSLVDYEPKLNLKMYRTLSDANRSIFDQAMTIKPASPTLELNPPKGTKT